MDSASTFGARLRLARGNRKQAMVAEACAVEPAAISMWEGDKNPPTVANLLSLANYLRVRIDWLVRGLPPKSTADSVDADALAVVLKELFAYLDSDRGELTPEARARVVKILYEEKTQRPESDWRSHLRVLIAAMADK